MAQQHGTTLERALTNYVTWSRSCAPTSIGGLDVIVNNLEPDGAETASASACAISPTTCSASRRRQLKQVQQGNAQQAAGQQIGALHQEIQGLKHALQQMHTQQQFTHTRSSVDQFADSHPRFDELGDLIENELQLGFDLETAYRRAELLQPATHAAQTAHPSGSDPRPSR